MDTLTDNDIEDLIIKLEQRGDIQTAQAINFLYQKLQRVERNNNRKQVARLLKREEPDD